MNFKKNYEKIETAKYAISVMRDALYWNYSILSEGVIAGEITDVEQIRSLVYEISEFMGEERFVELEKRLENWIRENRPEIDLWRLI